MGVTTPLPDQQSKPVRRVLADLFGALLILTGLVGVAYAAFQWNQLAGVFVCSVYTIGVGVAFATDTST